MANDDNVEKLPVRFKNPAPSGRTLMRPWEVSPAPRCQHTAAYLVDETLSTVECSLCGEKLAPMWVLSRLAGLDHRFHEARRTYQYEMKRLSARKRTRCDHCGQMTWIRGR